VTVKPFYLADPAPTIDSRTEPLPHDPDDRRNEPRIAAIRAVDSAQLHPTPAPKVRAAWNRITGTLRAGYPWWENHRNDGGKVEHPALAAAPFDQGMPTPIDLVHSDGIRLDPEPWTHSIPMGA